jgi:hypothetical protein
MLNSVTVDSGQERYVENYLKGLVILAVIFAHYSQYFLTAHYHIWFVGIAQSSLILFFILSGYGIYLSLNKRLGDRKRSLASRKSLGNCLHQTEIDYGKAQGLTSDEKKELRYLSVA